MRLNAVRRMLLAVCLLCGLWALVVTLSGGGGLQVGGLRISSSSPRNPLLIALVTGLLAWFLALTGSRNDDRPHRGTAFIALLTLLAIGLNILMQATPPPPPGVFTCYHDQPLRGAFRFQLNCDAMEFMTLADDPSRVFTQRIRQSRPLSFLIPYVVALPLHVLPDFDVIPVGPPLQKEFLGFVLVNVATLVFALLCFTWAYERGTGWRGGPEWLFVVVALSANEITKMFIWNPHTQILNLLLPVLTLYLNLRLLERGSALTTAMAVGLGLGFGAGLMVYGSFFVPVLCVIAIQWFAYRRLWPGFVTGATAVALYGAWVAFVYWRAGSFYSHEVDAYRQFVWMGDCVRAGAVACQATVATNAQNFFNATAPVLAVPMLLAIGLRVARALLMRDETSPPPPRTLLQACVLTWIVSFIFLALAGFYSPRLSWLLVPPVLMLVAYEGGALWRASGARRPWAVSIALATICIAHVLILAARQGPYW